MSIMLPRLHCILLLLLCVVQHLVCSLPLIESSTASHTTIDVGTKRNAGTMDPRDTLRQLEQIQTYYQHLYIRGLLRDNESATLVRLQNFIEQLRQQIGTTTH